MFHDNVFSELGGAGVPPFYAQLPWPTYLARMWQTSAPGHVPQPVQFFGADVWPLGCVT